MRGYRAAGADCQTRPQQNRRRRGQMRVVRIVRDETMQSNVKGLYPCGEGAGYAGGITSAAADGLKSVYALSEQ